MNSEEKSVALESKLDQALAGATVGAPKAGDYVVPSDTSDYYGGNREELLAALGHKPGEQLTNYVPTANGNSSPLPVGSGANAAAFCKSDMTGLPPVAAPTGFRPP